MCELQQYARQLRGCLRGALTEPLAPRPRPMTVSILDAWGHALMIAAVTVLLYRYLFPD